MEGRFDEAERLIGEAAALGRQAESWNASVSERLALFVLRREQGRLAELEDTMRRSVHEYPTLLRFRCALAHLYTELGREREAGAVLGELLVGRSLAKARRRRVAVQHGAASRRLRVSRAMTQRRGGLYSLLLPYEQRYAMAPDRSELRIDRAGPRRPRDQTRSASRTPNGTSMSRWRSSARMRARPWLAHAQHDMASMLLARGDRDARERAADRRGHDLSGAWDGSLGHARRGARLTAQLFDDLVLAA